MHEGRFERMDAAGWVSLAALAAAAIVAFPQRSALRWGAASLPFWVYGQAAEWILLCGVGLTIAAMAARAVGPTLPGRRLRRPHLVPLPHLAPGPLVPITPRTFPGAHRSRFLSYAIAVLGPLAVALIGLAAFGGSTSPLLLALGLAAGIVAATFAFGQWFATRVHVRIDADGVHGRTLFREHTARWSEIGSLHLREVVMPGFGMRTVYYVVQTAEREVAFPATMEGAGALRADIEAAAGVQWPEPGESTFP